MRRASTYLALLGLAALGVPVAASAAPVVTLVAKPIPIPGFPHTGDILGAGAALEVKYTINGSEAPGGLPSPLTRVTFWEPAGVRRHPQGFVRCKPEVLESSGPSGCPKRSQASWAGSAEVAQKIGSETVKEQATVQAFFAPGGGLVFYSNAASPISAQLIAATGNYIPGSASGPYGEEFTSEVKLVKTLPETEYVSVESINLKIGAAFRKGKKTVYYARGPKKCPKGGFPFKSELTFLSGETVTVTYRSPCPRR